MKIYLLTLSLILSINLVAKTDENYFFTDLILNICSNPEAVKRLQADADEWGTSMWLREARYDSYDCPLYSFTSSPAFSEWGIATEYIYPFIVNRTADLGFEVKKIYKHGNEWEKCESSHQPSNPCSYDKETGLPLKREELNDGWGAADQVWYYFLDNLLIRKKVDINEFYNYCTLDREGWYQSFGERGILKAKSKKMQKKLRKLLKKNEKPNIELLKQAAEWNDPYFYIYTKPPNCDKNRCPPFLVGDMFSWGPGKFRDIYQTDHKDLVCVVDQVETYKAKPLLVMKEKQNQMILSVKKKIKKHNAPIEKEINDYVNLNKYSLQSIENMALNRHTYVHAKDIPFELPYKPKPPRPIRGEFEKTVDYQKRIEDYERDDTYYPIKTGYCSYPLKTRGTYDPDNESIDIKVSGCEIDSGYLHEDYYSENALGMGVIVDKVFEEKIFVSIRDKSYTLDIPLVIAEKNLEHYELIVLFEYSDHPLSRYTSRIDTEKATYRKPRARVETMHKILATPIGYVVVNSTNNEVFHSINEYESLVLSRIGSLKERLLTIHTN